jgi:hypothetical protein
MIETTKMISSTRRAVLSDIHGNMAALNAVLADIARRGIPKEEIVILGDNVGYGGKTTDVIDEVMQYPNCMGNHELALDAAGVAKVGGLVQAGIHRPAAESIVIGRKHVTESGEKAEERMKFVTSSPLEVEIMPKVLGIHAFTKEESGDMVYVLPGKLARKYRMRGTLEPEEFFKDKRYFKRGTKVVAEGHDHGQWAVIFNSRGKHYEPETNPFEIRGREKAIIGIGSVGFSREQDPDFIRKAKKLGLLKKHMLFANYTIFHGNTIEFAYVLYSPKEIREQTIAAGMPDAFARYPFLPKPKEPKA